MFTKSKQSKYCSTLMCWKNLE